MLEQAFDDYFRMDMLQDFDGSSYSAQEKSHGRTETRVALVNCDLSVLGDIENEWPRAKINGHRRFNSPRIGCSNRARCEYSLLYML